MTTKKSAKAAGRRKKKNQEKRYDFKWANKLYWKKSTAAMAKVEYVSVFPFRDNNPTSWYLIKRNCDWKDGLVCQIIIVFVEMKPPARSRDHPTTSDNTILYPTTHGIHDITV